MSNKRHRRRFYPEFYTEEELENSSQNKSNGNESGRLDYMNEEYDDYDYDENEQENAETDNDYGDFIENLFDRTKKSEKTEKIDEPEFVGLENVESVGRGIPDAPPEITENTEEKEIKEIKENEIPSETQNDNEMPEMSIEIPKEMYITPMPVPQHTEFDNANAKNNAKENEPDNIKTSNESEDLKDSEEDLLVASIPTFAEDSTLDLKFNPEEPEKIDEPEPENLSFIMPAMPENTEISSPDIIPFDRDGAIEYARRWALDRNPKYYDFDDIGGDCTNYVSQTLLAGGCKMDKSSVIYGWYYNNANDKSPSWTGVEQLHDYLVRQKDYGIIAYEIDLNSVEAGDITQLSFNGKMFQHSPFIVSVKRNSDNSVSYDHIKICAHSFDSENRALDTYQWKKIRFIRIAGFKEK